MLHELFITHCTSSASIMNPFTFIKDSCNHETLLEARKLEKPEIHLAKSRTARIFNLRCLASRVTPKTLQIKWKRNNFEQAIIKKAECSLIHNRTKCTNIKIIHLQTEIANTMTSLQQKLDAPTFTNLQNIIFNNKEKTFLLYKNTQIKKLKLPHLQILHNNLQNGLQDNQHSQHCCYLFYFLMYPGQFGNQPLQEGTNT